MIILMQGSPRDLNMDEVKQYLKKDENIKVIDEIKIWQLGESKFIGSMKL